MSTTRLGGRQVAWMMAAFFGTIFAVNGVLAIYSIDSWPGLETESAYVTGLAYNRRLETARQEMEQLPAFDYMIVNENLDDAIKHLNAIVIAEKSRIPPRVVKL